MYHPISASPFSFKALLDAIDGIAYIVDAEGKILAVGSSWSSSPGDTPMLPTNVVGQHLFELINGEDVRNAYRAMHQIVLEKTRPSVHFEYRCDSPMTERYMRMSISPIVEDGQISALLYQSQILREQSRAYMPLFDPKHWLQSDKIYTAEQVLMLCSYCHDVAWPVGAAAKQREWITPQEYYRRSTNQDVVVSHGVCPDCYAEIVQT